MSVEQVGRRAYSPAIPMTERSGPHTFASYERALSEQRRNLREALAREEALRHELDKLTRQHKAVNGLFGPRQDAADRVARLTPRQRQIMELVLAGHPSKNIAADLGISQRTVENHRAAIMKRTASKSVPALTRLALAAAGSGADEAPSQHADAVAARGE
jgi:DNA-binding NarL/FixJ family response regulator